MIIRTLARRRNLLPSTNSVARAARCISQASASAPEESLRGAYRLPLLSGFQKMKDEGIPGLYSKEGFSIAWTEYHSSILETLDLKTAGIAGLHDKAVQDLVVLTAREPAFASTFNCASMAFNNAFFFTGISTEAEPHAPSPSLINAITTNFSSLDSLRETFIKTAESMFGPGFVWLVQSREQHWPWKIVCTYNAGSPLPGAHYRAQKIDMNTQNPQSLQGQPTNGAGHFGDHAGSAGGRERVRTALGGADLNLLLCVNTWEHAWLPDWGIRGKRRYLEAWWDRINWSTVEQKAQITNLTQRQPAFYGMYGNRR